MARIPYEGETSIKLKPLSTPGVRTTATVENLERGEMDLAKMFEVPVAKLQKFLIDKQNQLDLTKVQNAKSAWQENEFERKRWISTQEGTKAEGRLERETEYWENLRNPLKPEQMADVRVHDTADYGFKAAEFSKEDMAQRMRMHGLHDKFLAQYNELDDRQKLAMDEILMDRRPAYLHSIGVHEDKERRKATVAANAKQIEWSGIEAIQQGGDLTEGGQKSIDQGVNTIKADAKAFSEPQEVTKVRIQKFRSGVNEGVIMDLLNSPTDELLNLETAKKYFKTHEKEMTQKAKTAVSNALWAHEVAIKSSDIAMEISEMDDSDKFTAIANIEEDQIRKAVGTKVYQLDSIARRVKAQAQEDASTDIYDYIIASKGLGPDGKPLDLTKLPMDPFVAGKDQGPDLKAAYEILEVGDREQLQKILNGQIQGDRPVSELEDITNSEALMSLIVTDKKKFLGTNFAKDYYGKMTPERISFFQNLKRVTLEEDAKDAKEAKGENSVVSWIQQIDGRLGDLGWSGPDYVRHIGNAKTKIMAKIIQHRVDSNPKDPTNRTNPTDKEVQGYINDILTTTYISTTNTKFKPAGDELKDSFLRKEARLNAFFQSQGWTKEDDLEKMGAIRRAVQQGADKFVAATGKNPDGPEIQKIIDTVGIDKVRLDVGGNWYNPLDWFIGRDKDILYYQTEVDPNKYPKDKIYVMVKDFDYHVDGVKRKATGGKVYLVEHLSTMSTDERKEMGRWLEEHRMPFTHTNQALYWRIKHPEVVLSEEVINEDGLIQNPSGGERVKYLNLESIIAKYGNDIKSLKASRITIQRRYGDVALGIYDQMIKEQEAANE